MSKMYHIMQQWNNWLTQPLGCDLLQLEKKYLTSLLTHYNSKYFLLIGVPEQCPLLPASMTAMPIFLTPQIIKNKTIASIESQLSDLPIATSSIDLVLIPHTLEYLNDPCPLLTEACRILKPEGHIIILGFNPFSLWGLRKILGQNKSAPWSSHFIQTSAIKKWLKLADFEITQEDRLLFRPPLKNTGRYQKLKFLEGVGKKCYRYFGSVYVLVAKAKAIRLIPIRLQWQRKLADVRVTLPRPTIRDYFY